MMSLIKTILFFAIKVVLIEWTIELIRFLIHWVRQGTLPDAFFMTHSNPFLHWGLGILETGCVVLLLFFGFNIPFIIVFDLLLIYLTIWIAESFMQLR